MDRESLGTPLIAAAAYQLGDPILVTFKCKNDGTEVRQVLTWGTPLEAELTTDCLIVNRYGEHIQASSMLFARPQIRFGSVAYAQPINRPDRQPVALVGSLRTSRSGGRLSQTLGGSQIAKGEAS